MNASITIAVLALMAGVSQVAVSDAVPLDQLQVRSEMLVSTSWLQEHLHDANLVIVFIGRNRVGYDAGHIPGARFLSLDELVEQHKDSLNDLPPVATLQAAFQNVGVGDASRIILYGDAGGLMAARAYFTLDYLGHGERAALLDGGMERWISEGRPVELKAANPSPAKLTSHPRADILITTSQLQELIGRSKPGSDEEFVLLDARPPREFDGTVLSDGVPKSGHLPGAESLYWKILLRSESTPSLLSVKDLQATFQRVGAKPDKSVITYCRTGVQSSFTYFVAKYLGYRAAMYDGSVYEWVNRSGYDLVTSAPSSSEVTSQR